MSATLIFCTMLGIEVTDKLEEIQDKEDIYLPYIEGHPNLKMSIQETHDDDKNRAFFGLVLARGDKYEDTFVKKIDLDEMIKLREEVVTEFEKLFGEKKSVKDCSIFSFDYYL